MWVHWVCWILWYLNKNHSTWFQWALFHQNDFKMNRNWMVQGKLLRFHVSLTITNYHHQTLDRPKMAEVLYTYLDISLFFSQSSLNLKHNILFVLLIQHRPRKCKTIFISLLTRSSIFVRKRVCRSVLWFLKIHVPKRQKPPQKILLILTTWINLHIIIHTVYD